MTAAWGDEPSRRSVLAGGGLLLLSACTGSSTPHSPGLTADQRLAHRVAVEVDELATAYALTIAAHPKLRTALAPLAAEHVAHSAALVALLPKPTSTPDATGSPSSSTSTPSTAPSATVPSTPGAAREALAAAERAAAARRRHQAGAAGPELARLLASIAACEAVHAALVAS